MKEAFELIRKRIEEITVDRNIHGSITGCNMGICEDDDCLKCLKKKILSIVSEVEAEYGNGWIDVKDRLPEKDGYYLTCDHKGNIHVFYHHPSYVANGNNMAFGICKNHPQFYRPIAWMELPNPYNRLERK